MPVLIISNSILIQNCGMSLNRNNEFAQPPMKENQSRQNRQPSQMKNVNKDKIEYLHKLLDHELQTVSTLFQKDNAFDQIQAKLKMLEVKLSSIKDQNKPINSQHVISTQYNELKRVSLSGSSYRNEKMVSSKCISDLPFESLSKYKKQKKETVEKSKTKIASKESFQYSHSGKKLNFDGQDQNKQEGETIKRQKKIRESGSKKFISNKVKSETLLHHQERRPNSIKSKLSTDKKQQKASMQTISRQNSISKKRVSISKTDKKERESSKKKLGQSKTTSHLHSWKDIVKIYGSTKQKEKDLEVEKKEKVKQVIRKSEAKRLQKQLRDYRAQNEALKSQVTELKSYKSQFEKLKTIFQKDERIRKSRKII